MMTKREARGAQGRRRGFTLVELLVVVSIIALLISILLPSLRKARDQAKTIKCAANIRASGLAVSTYLSENNAFYPASYRYPTSPTGAGGHADGDENHPYGYVHWSYALFSGGRVKEDVFQCPTFPKGGVPRTNPGPNPNDWEEGQVDDSGQKCAPSSLEDKQARRMAYTANAALIPRNKFTLLLSGGQRTNVLIPEDKVKRPGETILLTEFHRNWKLMGISSPNGSGTLVKSHRPVNVFYHLGSSYNEYNAPKNAPGFVYGKGSNNLPRTQDDYGVYPLNQIEQHEGALDYTSGVPQINAVGRNHPGGDNVFGGTANFVFADNHVERMTPHQSLQQRKWGERYYSLNGANEVLNYRTK